jgi:hypothetical protein
MDAVETWFARLAAGWWLVYLVAGIVWVTLGTAVLGNPQGIGLLFIGLACLSLGVYGAGWRLSHGYGLTRPLPWRFPDRG